MPGETQEEWDLRSAASRQAEEERLAEETRIRHECEAMPQHALVYYYHEYESHYWALWHEDGWIGPITHCPYCGVELHTEEP